MIDVCDIQVMKPMLAAHGFHFSKAKGQNFLIAPWVPQSIAEQAGVDETAGVLEIGPGIGPLTQQLCLRAGKVCAVEVDERLKPILDVTVGNFSNLEILWGDVLKQDIPALVKEKFGTLRPMACANLPYYITSPILTALLEAECFQSVTVMVQKEVAQRIAAKPGTPDYSAFTVFCQYYAEPELLFDVPAHCFLPQPKVTSAVITLRTRQKRPWDIADEAVFFRAVRASFAMRRKKLSNGLSSGGGRLRCQRAGRNSGHPGICPDRQRDRPPEGENAAMMEFLFLDLDDTILDFHKAERIALSKTLTEFGVEPAEEVLTLYHRINLWHWEQLEKGKLTRDEVQVGRFAALFRELGVSADAVRCTRSYEGNLAVGHYFLPGAEEAVANLSQKYRLFLASNGTASVQSGRLTSANLYRFFETVFISQELGFNKPAKEFFDACFARIPDFDPKKAVMVGDSLTSDILGGKNAGITTVWVNPERRLPHPEIVPDYEIESLAQLEALLETM